MKKLLIIMVVLAAFCLVPTITASADQTVLRSFFIGGKSLGDHWNIISSNFFIKSAQATTYWSFIGPRYTFGDSLNNYLDLFIGCTFPVGKTGALALSPRFQLTFGQFYVWQDMEWYPFAEQLYSETKIRWKSPLQGFDLGLTGSSFTPSWHKATIWNIGPEADLNLSGKMAVGLAWQYQRAQYGGSYVRFTTLLFFF